MTVQIVKCSYPGAWWEGHVGEYVDVLWTDQYGHWTRDTGPMRLLQWVRVEDCQPDEA